MIIVDVGACVGIFIDHCLQNHEVQMLYAFEPLGANYDFLVEKYGRNPKIKIFKIAVSNYDGEGPFYKKPNWNNPELFDFAGNVGCSLRKDKSNVRPNHFDTVSVTSLHTFFAKESIAHVDILKIDSEGSEYDIIEDLLEHHRLDMIDKIWYEDHLRKIPALRQRRIDVLKKAKSQGFANKFYIQVAHEPISYRQEDINW